MKELVVLAAAMSLCLCLFGCKKEEQKPAASAPVLPEQEQQPLAVLYTADIHGMAARPQYGSEKSPMGCAAVKAYADRLAQEGSAVLLVDGGDSGLDEKLLKQLDYSVMIPGQLELDQGIAHLLETELPYVCCNILNAGGETVFAPYKIIDHGQRQLAFVGITSPLCALEEGYSFPEDETAFYELVQAAIDEALSQGADMVIAVGYLGMDPGDSPYTSAEVIGQTSGLTAFLDSRGHVLTEGAKLTDKNDKEVLILSAGTELTYIGVLQPDLMKNTLKASLINGLTEDDEAILAAIEELSTEPTEEPTE